MSPLVSNIDKQTANDRKHKKGFDFAVLNFFIGVVIIILLVGYAIVINGNMGNGFEYDNLTSKKETLKEVIRKSSKSIDDMMVPAKIQARVQDNMVRTEKTSYLREVDRQVAIVLKNN
jgi:quinol-cytochrome oxidoreductase complex cytochrome b subunit